MANYQTKVLKTLRKRQKAHDDFVRSLTGKQRTAYRRPGSMNRRKG